MENTLNTIKEYSAHLDNKKRITLRNAKYEYYQVRELENGAILLEPRVLVAPETISTQSLKMMDTAMDNFKKGVVSKPLDFSKL